MLIESQASTLVADAVAHIERTARPLIDGGSALPADVHARGMEWIEQFVMKPHPELGRPGAVCPFVQYSYTNRALYVAGVDADDMSFAQFIQLMLRLPDVYTSMLKTHDLPLSLFALMLYLPNLGRDKYFKFIDLTHAITKPMFMDAGLILGEFHPDSHVRGVHSSRIKPLRSTIPAFVVRAIAPHDILFIDRVTSPPAVRIHELECYLEWTKMPPQRRDVLQRRIDALKSGVDPARLGRLDDGAGEARL
jgi:hypothetical protein